jgi:beta-mannosidase
VLTSSAASDLGAIQFPAGLSNVHFVRLELMDGNGRLLSDNTYWRNTDAPDDLKMLDSLPTVTLEATVSRHDAGSKVLLDVTLTNASAQVALLAHVQLRNQRTNLRVLPVFYSDNYVSLLPGERRMITVEAAAKDLGADRPVLALDGWNVAPALVR